MEVEPDPELPVAEALPDITRLPDPLLLLLPTRVVAALIADDPLEGPPVAPPPFDDAELDVATNPVWLSDDIVELGATDEVDCIVTLLCSPIEPPPNEDPRRLLLPLSRGPLMLTYFSATVVPASRSVGTSVPASSFANRRVMVVSLPVPASEPAGRSCQ